MLTVTALGVFATHERGIAASCNTFDDLGALNRGVERTGRLESGDCIAEHTGRRKWADVYEFSLTESRQVTLDLRSSDIDPMLALIDSQGNRIELDDDGGPGRNALIVRPLHAGRYRVEVSKYDSPAGFYQLRISIGAAEGERAASGTGCTVQQLGDLTNTVERTGWFESGDCIAEHTGRRKWADVYEFSLTESRQVTLDLRSSDIDPMLALIDSQGNRIELDDDGGPGRNALIVRPLYAGRYRIEATTFYYFTSGSYQLQISVEALGTGATSVSPGVSECTTQSLGTVTGPVGISGSFSRGDCIAEHTSRAKWADHYTFALAHAHGITIDLQSPDVDPMLVLIDSQGQVIELNDDGGDGLNARIHRNLNAGTYRVEATKYGNGPGTYGLEISCDMSRLTDPNVRQQIAERFAPVLVFDSREEYFPVPIEAMLEFAVLKQHRDLFADRVISRQPTAALLGRQGAGASLDQFLEFDRADYDARDHDYAPVIYARVTDTLGDRLVVQYWFFYVYNPGPLVLGETAQEHEGDWEGIQLVFPACVDADDVLLKMVGPESIWLATHEEGELYAWGDARVQVRGGTHPVVYPALGSHATYLAAGSHATAFSVSDEHDGDGWSMEPNPLARLVVLPPVQEGGEVSVVPSGYEIRMIDQLTDWTRWHGRWGRLGVRIGDRVDDLWSGPRGPVQKLRWIAPIWE